MIDPRSVKSFEINCPCIVSAEVAPEIVNAFDVIVVPTWIEYCNPAAAAGRVTVIPAAALPVITDPDCAVVRAVEAVNAATFLRVFNTKGAPPAVVPSEIKN